MGGDDIGNRGRRLTAAELDDLIHGEPDLRCDTCNRAGFGETHGGICNMVQPDESRCDGVFARVKKGGA